MSLEEDISSFINSLDLYIVSHGGVGSNYLVDYLESKGLRVKNSPGNYTELKLYQQCCHAPNKVNPEKPCIYIYGDIPNAVLSQYQRNLLVFNSNKMVLDKDEDINRLSEYLKTRPEDPLGIKTQIENFSNCPNTYLLQYPYTKEDVEKALTHFGFSIDLSEMVIRERGSRFTSFDDISDPLLKSVLTPYL